MALMDFADIFAKWERRPDARLAAEKAALHRRREQEQDESARESINPRRFPIEAELDLHGMTEAQAEAALLGFLDGAVRRGLRKVRIIHGKGAHSQKKAVLPRLCRRIFETHPQAGEFGPETREGGGKGASWVILRQRSR